MARRLLALLLLAVLAVLPVGAQNGETIVDPTGSYQFTLPQGWIMEEGDGFLVVTDPEREIINVLSVEDTADMEESIALLWEKYDPEFDFSTPILEQDVPEDQLQGFEAGIIKFYADGTGADGALITAASYVLDGRTYPSLLISNLAAVQRRISQVLIFAQTYRAVGAVGEEDERDAAQAQPWTDDMAASLRDFMERALPMLEVPGAAIAIVQDGEVVFAEGFGSTGADPVDADTVFLTASLTKSMTTLAMAQAVDEGLFTWETPAIEVLPSFAVADDDVTQTITMENLVCACSGVPRRDFEIILNTVTAQDILDSLRTFEFFTPFGEAFQYSNQLVAAAGYLTAVSRGATPDTLFETYAALVEEGIFTPLGMERTTARLDDLAALGNVALPHGVSLEGTHAFPLEDERWMEAIAPSGGVWSSVNDMARYLRMQLGGGELDGTRIVSEQNLARTWQPQVDVDAHTRYGLGWILSEYEGNPVIFHDGNALGYTSQASFLPEAGVGIVVLANRAYSPLPALAGGYALELLFAQEDEVAAQVDEIHANLMIGREAIAWQYNQTPDLNRFADFAGEWTNDALGTLTISAENGDLIADFGEYRTRLWEFLTSSTEPEATPEARAEAIYISVDAPLSGQVALRFREDAIILGSGAAEYTFTRP